MNLLGLRPTDALIIVDMQKDFCPGGAIPVTECDLVLDVLNIWIEAAERSGSAIVASRDWHPQNHVSFEPQGGPWPPHCVQGTEGAELCDGLRLPPKAVLIDKGTEPDVEQYSPFETVELQELLKSWRVSKLWIGGVARDVSVKASALQALRLGFKVHLIADATAALNDDDGRKALQELQAAGAILE